MIIGLKYKSCTFSWNLDTSALYYFNSAQHMDIFITYVRDIKDLKTTLKLFTLGIDAIYGLDNASPIDSSVQSASPETHQGDKQLENSSNSNIPCNHKWEVYSSIHFPEEDKREGYLFQLHCSKCEAVTVAEFRDGK